VTGVDALQAEGFTGLYDAVDLGVSRLASQTSATARALVVLTDGGDDGSKTNLATVRQAVVGSGLPFHAVGFISPEFAAGPMRELSEVSRGSYRETANPGELASLYRQIADELTAEYRITYQSTAGAGRHRLQVVADARGAQVSAEREFQVVTGAPATTVPAGPRLTIPEPPGDGAVDEPSMVPFVVMAVLGMMVITGAVMVVRRARRGGEAGEGDDGEAAVTGGEAAAGEGEVEGPAPPIPQPPRPMLEGPGVSVRVTESMLIGRGPVAQVIVDDPTVARYHAKLVVRPEGIWIEDLGSSRGTLVNGVKVDRRRVRAGDALDLGDLHLVLREEQEPEPDVP
jgi:hypothetical protein